jgi:hypothetical protein
MKKKYMAMLGLVALLLVGATSAAMASTGAKPAESLPKAVREATAQFNDVRKAQAAGYGVFHGCVSGQQEGAMGVHFANPSLVDGAVELGQPEALLYEPKGDELELAGVEYVVIAEAWNASHPAPPVLMGQLFNFVSAPNRYGLPAFYELHVWAWERNPSGMFADWNPRVSCEDFVGEAAGHGH